MARCETYLVLTSDEVNFRIPYALVCMTRFGAHWETGRRRRRWLEEFTEQERTAATRLFNQSHRWLLTTGVPETVRDDGADLRPLDEAGRVLCFDLSEGVR